MIVRVHFPKFRFSHGLCYKIQMKGLIGRLVYLKDAVLSVFLYIIGVINFILGAIVIFLIGLFTTGKLFEWAINTFSKMIILLAGVRVEVTGRENIEEGRKYIVMMNHVNIFDAFVFKSSFRKRARGIEEEKHMNWPIYGQLMRRIGMIPISRKNPRRAVESLKKAGEILRAQKDLSIGIMPEGTRTRNGKLSKFKRGGFLLALESGLDILPMIQVGSFQIKQKTGWIIRPGKVTFHIEKPIPIEGFTKDNIHVLMDKVRAVMLQYVD